MPRPPVDPENFDKVNYVIDAWSRPCNAPWYIYVETLKPALLAAFITLVTFGWDDVARGYFRPRGLGRRTGKKRGRGRTGVLRRFPEFGEETGKRLPGADKVKGIKWGRGTKSLWRIDTAMQRILFYWLVADIIEDFWFDWTSVLYETVWCQASDEGRFSYHETEFRTIAGNGWWNMQFAFEDYEFDPPSWLFISGESGPSGCLAAAAIEFKKHPSFPAPTSTAVRLVERFGTEVYAQGGPEFTDPDGSNSIAVSGNIPPNTRFRVQAWHDADFAFAGAGAVTGMETVE